MLDSVLRTRDCSRRPEGMTVLSQYKMVLVLCDASEVSDHEDRVSFRNNPSTSRRYDAAIVDVVPPEIILGMRRTVTVDFVSSFKPVSSIERRTKVDSFTLYLAAFFTIDGQPMVEGTKVKVIRENDIIPAEVWFIGGRPVPRRRVSSGAGKSPEAKTNTSSLTKKPVRVTHSGAPFHTTVDSNTPHGYSALDH
ncbi:hypothetical protein B0H16DRAFT_1715970 [Mycena metata]|uniref:Uncharacterized protein n=1 Tax=Mycena metata TaxID=1033252 RepID=A0AAD7NP17_9AGAR|nr:hypothetical protein B0H16DRAFT_1715970 [Mycena metata]